jgi:hypothetical protein
LSGQKPIGAFERTVSAQQFEPFDLVYTKVVVVQADGLGINVCRVRLPATMAAVGAVERPLLIEKRGVYDHACGHLLQVARANNDFRPAFGATQRW